MVANPEELKQAETTAREIAEILTFIKDKGYELTDYDRGKIDGMLTLSKPETKRTSLREVISQNPQ